MSDKLDNNLPDMMPNKLDNNLPDMMPNESAADYLVRVLFAGLRIPKRFLMPEKYSEQ